VSIRVLLADDHQIVRQGLRGLLEKQPDIEVIGEAGDGRTTLSLIEELSPNIVIMDVAMPDLNGIEATRQIIARHPGIKVLALSMYSDRRFVAGMLGAGASGYEYHDSWYRSEKLHHSHGEERLVGFFYPYIQRARGTSASG
jgi:DNA-binding NarL/FixJ family response regulator